MISKLIMFKAYDKARTAGLKFQRLLFSPNFQIRFTVMARGSVDMNFLFTLGELQRLVRAYADRQAARYGITRAQWAVLAKVERFEGMKQTELAEQMEMQPITLTRLIDRLCDNGWIERRSDDSDRRVNRLYLRKAAKPLLAKLAGLKSELTATALEGINPSDANRLLAQLETIKENVRNAIQEQEDARKEQRYG
jgi:MarR family transcriptional regulator for hemolysin